MKSEQKTQIHQDKNQDKDIKINIKTNKQKL